MLNKPLHWIGVTLFALGLGAWMALPAHEAGANRKPAAEPAIDCKSTRAAREACAARDVCAQGYGVDPLHSWGRDREVVCHRTQPMT